MRRIRTTGVVALVAALSLLAAACADAIGDPTELAQGTGQPDNGGQEGDGDPEGDGHEDGGDGHDEGDRDGDGGHGSAPLDDLGEFGECLEENGVEIPSFEHESGDADGGRGFSFELVIPEIDEEELDEAYQACEDLLPELDPELEEDLGRFEECIREQDFDVPDLPELHAEGDEDGFRFEFGMPDFDFDGMFDALGACSDELPSFGELFDGFFDGPFSGEEHFDDGEPFGDHHGDTDADDTEDAAVSTGS